MLSNKLPHESEQSLQREKRINSPANKLNMDLFFDGFIVSPNQYTEVALYSCDARSYDADDFNFRLGVTRKLKNEVPGIKAIVVKRYIATNIPLESNLVDKYNLNRILEPSTYLLVQSQQRLIEITYKYNWNHPEFNRLKTSKPILSLGVFNQYLEYHPRVYSYNGRFILRPNPSMTYFRSDTCHDLIADETIRINTNMKYIYQSKSCVLRDITSRTISHKDPVLGISLLEHYRKNTKFAPYISRMEQNPDMIVLEVDHDRFNQGKNTTRYSIAACLITPDIRLDDIPEQFRGRFMTNSHVNMNTRYERVLKFLEGVSEQHKSELIQEPADITSLGLTGLKASDKRLMFGDGYTTNEYSAYDNFKSLTRHKVFKSPNSSKKVGIIPFKDSHGNMLTFSKEIARDLKSIGIDCEIITLDAYSLNSKGRLNQFELAEKYQSLDIDCALIELPEYSDNWTTWKNALSPVISLQMITTNKMRNAGVSFNTALGVASCLGAMPIGLNGNLTGIKTWIGMDVFSEGKKHIAAASAVCDADGMLIGYPPSEVCSGERLDDAVLERTLRIIMDGLSYYYGKEGSEIPSPLGLIRDGEFFENPNVISTIEKEYDVSFIVVDVKKQGAPKLAVENGDKYAAADCGTIICGENGGYVQTTGVGNKLLRGTPILREIRLIRGDVKIADLLEDMFWLSKIHGGSTQQPGLPIPQAYAHKIAKMAGRGVVIPNKFNTDLGFL